MNSLAIHIASRARRGSRSVVRAGQIERCVTNTAAIAIISGDMKTSPVAALLGASLVMGASTVAFAQTAEPPALVPTAPVAAAPKEARAVKIVNVPSAFIAYWLDPANNERPAPFYSPFRPAPLSVPFADKPLLNSVPEELSKGVFLLPDGIERIVSVDAQNVVLITGTARAIRQMEDLIGVLDQPLRQVEIEAQFVELASDELKNFGIDFSTENPYIPRTARAFQIGFVRNNFTARLNALIADDKAKVITAPRVTAINNLPAIISSSMEKPVGGNAFKYSVTPSINGDDTITILIQDTDEPAEGKTNLTTIANLRDGDTIALSDVTSLRPTDPERVVVVFLTARIIRRAGEMPKK